MRITMDPVPLVVGIYSYVGELLARTAERREGDAADALSRRLARQKGQADRETQKLVRALNAERRGESGEAEIDRRKLGLDPHLLRSIDEGLLDAVEAALVGKLVVMIVGEAEPEAHGVDQGARSGTLVLCTWLSLGM